MKKWIKNNLYNNRKLVSSRSNRKWFINNGYVKHYDNIISLTKFLDNSSRFSERIYCIINDIKSSIICKKCHNNVNFISFNKGYNNYCSIRCHSSSEEKKKQIRIISKRKYGKEHFSQSSIVKEKIKKTCLERYKLPCTFALTDRSKINYKNAVKKREETCIKKYGVKNHMQNKKVLHMINNKFKKNHGVENSFQLEDIKEKIKKTCLEKYGENHWMKSNIGKKEFSKIMRRIFMQRGKNIITKMKNTMIDKYGYDSAIKVPFIKEKIKKTCLEKYGYKIPSKNNVIKEKIKNSHLKNFNRNSYTQLHIPSNTLLLLNDRKWLENEYKTKPMYKIANETNVSKKTIQNYIHKHKIKTKECRFSFSEKEVLKFINIGNVQTNIRNIISPHELDIYIPDYNLAIEFDGLYWHSRKSKNYHLNKTKTCEEKGIQLLHIFENEWLDKTKQEIWKSIINGKLGRNKIIYGRKTEIREIKNNSLLKEFLNNNHLQGFTGSSIKLGLFYEDELVSLMTFGKTRFSKKYQYEMIRFCNKKFTTVIGGASKLYKHFTENYEPRSVVSYADRRYSNGDLYEKLGFEFSHNSKPNYWYFKLPDTILYSRIKFQKHKLSKILENYDSSKSEAINMLDNNYLRIFDCGNIIFINELN